jgi:hypothetical protein
VTIQTWVDRRRTINARGILKFGFSENKAVLPMENRFVFWNSSESLATEKSGRQLLAFQDTYQKVRTALLFSE